jgi:large subunit ribosomal protein L24
LVERINLVKKHKRQTRQDQQGGIVSVEAKINISNLALLCKHCDRPARVGFKSLADGSKTRFCKSCNELM